MAEMQDLSRTNKSAGARALQLTAAAALLLCLGAGTALAETTDSTGTNNTLPGLAVELGKLAIIAVVVESALAAIFQWRVYRMLFNNKALKTVVMFCAGLLVVKSFGYDPFENIVRLVVDADKQEPWVSIPLSALIIAGGSAGVNTIFQRLGIRNPVKAEEELQPVLDEDQAWISVRAIRKRAIGPIKILVSEQPAPAAQAGQAAPVALAATLRKRSLPEKLAGAFTADEMRMPNYGGRTVKTGVVYRIVATGTIPVQRGADQTKEVNKVVYEGAFAPRAIVDFTVEI